VAKNKKYSAMFVEAYGDELTANILKRISKNKAQIAKEWYRKSEYFHKRKIVSSQFEKIGIKDIVQLCEDNNGFEVYREPNSIEKECIDLLRNLATEIIGDIICYKTIHSCTIDETKKWIDNMKNKDFELVNPIFRLLGARSLVEKMEEKWYVGK
jgi:hypothetical protein